MNPRNGVISTTLSTFTWLESNQVKESFHFIDWNMHSYSKQGCSHWYFIGKAWTLGIVPGVSQPGVCSNAYRVTAFYDPPTSLKVDVWDHWCLICSVASVAQVRHCLTESASLTELEFLVKFLTPLSWILHHFMHAAAKYKVWGPFPTSKHLSEPFSLNKTSPVDSSPME